MKVDNAIIMAAGTSSRFAPLSYETHKGLIEVRGEILVERQIRQLREAGINDIIIVTGYKADSFGYLKDKFGVRLIHNPDFLVRNNNSSIHAVREFLSNSYVCSVDNYFVDNPFSPEVDESYYAAQFSKGDTDEWCMTTDAQDYIDKVTIGGKDSWYMMGHTFWSRDFSKRFLEILDSVYDLESSRNLLWEDIYIRHLDTLKMKIRKYRQNDILEFDTLDELRVFDPSYVMDTRSTILKRLCRELNCNESDIRNIRTLKSDTNAADGFCFDTTSGHYSYRYMSRRLEKAI